MDRRKNVIVAVLVLINLPVALAAIEAVSYYVVNRDNGSIVSSGETRDYRLYVPKTYDAAKPAPLVISMHGAGLWGASQMDISQWNKTADEHGVIVVYPSALRGRGPAIWRAEGSEGLPRDVRFISELIDSLQAAYNIDPARIYADGLSNGGGMAFVLSCTLSDRIAAVGMVGAAHLLPWNWCKDQRPVPMIAFHGTADPMTPYGGGKTWIAPQVFPDTSKWVANWARRNRCAPTPVESAVASDVTRRAYPNCADHADVVLYTIIGGGHTWPGGGPLPEWYLGPVNRSISASDLLWAFYREHPLSPR